ncbi:hypothetical protein F511_46237 [Dorcoceras hygrometricum]|uniref:Uncharacterized protein n=1 Tax=Dorcoceras hygrometricum TaxID=472368 RepID=A0A2Z7A0Z2_9LAMI|nr:hypothetical protein F511_46237 [Dorcoceras hygrometricum]
MTHEDRPLDGWTSCTGCATWRSTMIAGRATLRAAVRHAWRDIARLLRANFVSGGRRRRPTSGDVVTADFF